jgi:hypothetical protein
MSISINVVSGWDGLSDSGFWLILFQPRGHYCLPTQIWKSNGFSDFRLLSDRVATIYAEEEWHSYHMRFWRDPFWTLNGIRGQGALRLAWWFPKLWVSLTYQDLGSTHGESRSFSMYLYDLSPFHLEFL